MKDNPILITGCARSGTSMTGGVFHICGAWGGEMSGPNNNNKRGMFENTAIRNEMVKPYLRSIGCDPKGQYPLPDPKRYKHLHKDFVREWQDKVIGIIEKQKDPRHGHWDLEKPWFYKGAKACLFWQVWASAFPKAKWIIVRRDDLDIVESCMRTGFMNYYQYREGWYKWVSEHKDRFIDMFFGGIEFKFVWPEQMIMGNFDEIREAVEWAGLKWNGEEVRKFISPELWKAKWAKVKKMNKKMEDERYGHKSD